MSRSWTGCQWHLCLVPALSGAVAYITVWQGYAARRKHAGFQQHIIIFDFSVCSVVFHVVGEAAVQNEEQDSDTLQSSVSFYRTKSPKRIPVARESATATKVPSGVGAALESSPDPRSPEIDLKHVYMSLMGCREVGVPGSA